MSFKPLTCPNCGAQIQLDSSNDFGFCMYCGSKIMLTQKINVEHSGSVNIGNIDSLLKKGFREIDLHHVKNAAETFNKAAEIDCDNIYVMIGQIFKAVFSDFTGYYFSFDLKMFEILKSKYDEISPQEKEVINIQNCTDFFRLYCDARDIGRIKWIIKNYLHNIDFEDNHVEACITYAVIDGCDLISVFLDSNLDVNMIFDGLFARAYTGPNLFSNPKFDVNKFPLYALKKLLESDKIISQKTLTYFDDGCGEKYSFELNRFIYALTSEKLIYTDDIELVGDPDKITEYVEYLDKLKRLGKYRRPQKTTIPQVKGKKHLSRCYVATAVYGSYDCPEVWTLRRFRDDILSKNLIGRLFIFLYYSISPKLVELFGDTDWFKNMWRPFLDKMVNKLNHNGVENTPYNDHQW